jgi:hypothetical protein
MMENHMSPSLVVPVRGLKIATNVSLLEWIKVVWTEDEFVMHGSKSLRVRERELVKREQKLARGVVTLGATGHLPSGYIVSSL